MDSEMSDRDFCDLGARGFQCHRHSSKSSRSKLCVSSQPFVGKTDFCDFRPCLSKLYTLQQRHYRETLIFVTSVLFALMTKGATCDLAARFHFLTTRPPPFIGESQFCDFRPRRFAVQACAVRPQRWRAERFNLGSARLGPGSAPARAQARARAEPEPSLARAWPESRPNPD